MKRILEVSGAFIMLGFGIGGLAGIIPSTTPVAAVLTAAGALMSGLVLLRITFIAPQHPWATGPAAPQQLRLGVLDYFKALASFLLGFQRTYAVAPGLYYTGDHHDPDAPLLVTANYHLTVFLIARQVRSANARLLVIDTDGINVWCAAGKGSFGNDAISRQLDRYSIETLSGGDPVRLILPKLGMSGVDLRQLRAMGLRPVVGPVYAHDLPAYLVERPYRHRRRDRVRFGLRSRAFVWVPGLLQVTPIAALMAAAAWALTIGWGGTLPVGIIGTAAALATVYALCFPWIPGRRFAVKGLVLGLLFSSVTLIAAMAGALRPVSLIAAIPFIVAAGLLIGLEFTGNSAVANYSRVKLEIARFLPVSAVLFVVSLGALIATEVLT